MGMSDGRDQKKDYVKVQRSPESRIYPVE